MRYFNFNERYKKLSLDELRQLVANADKMLRPVPAGSDLRNTILQERKVLTDLIAEREANGEKGLCRWFAKCDKPATGFTKHSVLGKVPTCDRCHKFATGETR